MLTKKQAFVVNHWRDRGIPAEFAILAVQCARSAALAPSNPDLSKRFSDWLLGGFVWRHSPEGQGFWSSVWLAVVSEENAQ